MDVGDSMLLGSAPTQAVVSADGETLFVTDAAAGRVADVAIGTRETAALVTAGRTPGACVLDPSGDLLLVADEDSSDVAVIGVRTASLLTLLPVGARPVSLAVKMF
jgi:YVTN family beta-propeller protein